MILKLKSRAHNERRITRGEGGNATLNKTSGFTNDSCVTEFSTFITIICNQTVLSINVDLNFHYMEKESTCPVQLEVALSRLSKFTVGPEVGERPYRLTGFCWIYDPCTYIAL